MSLSVFTFEKLRVLPLSNVCSCYYCSLHSYYYLTIYTFSSFRIVFTHKHMSRRQTRSMARRPMKRRSDSSSDSSSSDDDDRCYYNKKVHHHPHVIYTHDARSASPPHLQQQQKAVPYTPQYNPHLRDYMPTQTERGQSVTPTGYDGNPDTVSILMNANVPYTTIEARERELNEKKLVFTTDHFKVNHSNPLDKAPEVLKEGDVDVVEGIKVSLKHNFVEPILVTTNVRALRDEVLPPGFMVDPESITDDVPYGRIAVKVDPDVHVNLEYKREFSEGERNFMDAYPGQTEKDIDNFVHFLSNGDAMISAAPRSFISHFYNKDDAVKENPSLSTDAIRPDSRNRIYVDKAILERAKANAAEAIPSFIGYSNVTDPSKLTLEVRVMPETILDKSLKSKVVAPSFTEAVRKSPVYLTEMSRLRTASSRKELDSMMFSDGAPGLKLKIDGNIQYDYHKYRPDFINQDIED